MVSSKQLRKLATSPVDMMRFQTTGKLPQGVTPESPLIDLLEAIGGRDRTFILGVTIDERLGYSGSRTFHTAQQALLWVKPSNEVFDSFPAESWRLKDFRKALSIDDLAECCKTMPEHILKAYPRLRSPAARRPSP